MFTNPHRHRILTTAILSTTILLAAVRYADAASFNLTSGTTTGAQTLAVGETGSIAAGATLSVSGSTVAVTITGNNAMLTNLGTLKQTGTGRAIRDNTGVTGLVITNGSITNSTALMQSADADVIQMNKTPASVTLNNYGTMTSLNASAGGAQVADFTAILSGSNVINNYATGKMLATDADAVRPGVNGVVFNGGLIRSTIVTTSGTNNGLGSDGVDAQNNSGVQITNDTTGLIDGGRHGITGGNTTGSGAYTMSITNNLGGTIKGNNGSGINIDGINANEIVTIVNHGMITGNGGTGDGDGVDVDGVVNLTNTGMIQSLKSFNDTSEGVTVGGGTIVNSGTIQGLNPIVALGNQTGTGRGITIAGVDKDANNLPIPIQAPYAATTITNSGLIKGDSDSGIAFTSALASDFSHTINNQAGGTIQGGGTTVAAIVLAADNTTINNSGTIDGSSSGKAITGGTGNLTLNITGGTITGAINGGTGGANIMTLDLGLPNSFAYSGSISNFSMVEVKSGSVEFSGVSNYTGTTKLTGGLLTLDAANLLSAASSLDLNGGSLKIIASVPNGQTFASLSLENSSTIDLDPTSLTFNDLGTVVSGKALTILDYVATASPYYAFRFLGDLTDVMNPDHGAFLTLVGETTINGLAATDYFDGTYTNVVPVPEPATFGFGIALMGVAFARRRRAGAVRASN